MGMGFPARLLRCRHVKLRTLGGLALEGSSLTRPKPLLMLAYLTLNGATTRRELADTFYHDALDARDSLSTGLRHLRKIDAVALLDDDRVAGTVACDAADLLRDFDAYRYEAVLQAYQGPFLDGLDIDLGIELEEWLFANREAIARRVRSAAIHRARAAIAEQRLDDARRLATFAMTLSGAPELEPDELASALPVLERLEMPEGTGLRELAESYGVDVERPDVADTAPTRRDDDGSLHRNTAFVGRRDELRQLDKKLREPAVRLVTLFGMGGVGKTRLAARLAERLSAREQERYPDGVVLVPLETLERADQVVPTIAARLALPAAVGTSVDELAAALANWRALLVLDNFEHVMGAGDAVVRLLRDCPTLQMVVTSRTRLGLGDEWTVELGGLSTKHDGERLSDAASLFLERAERVGYAPEAAKRDQLAIESLCQFLEGHPLAIELAASMTRALDLEEIGSSLIQSLDVLDHGPVDAPARHRAIRSMLEPSWALLQDEERYALIRLSVFRTSFQTDAATAVAGTSLRTLLRLVDHAMLRSEGSHRGRFGFHPVMQAFLRERADRGAVDMAAEAHRQFFARWLETSAERVASEPREVLERLQADLPDVLHAVRSWLDAGRVTAATAMMRALVVDADYLQARGGGHELIALTREVAQAAERNGQLTVAERLWTKVANAVRTLLSDVDEAARLYEHALDLAYENGDVRRRVMLHAILGAVLDERSPDAATEHLTAARSLAEAADDDLLRCEVLQRCGYAASRRKDWQQARDLNAEAVELAERAYLTGRGGIGRATSLLYFSLLNLGTAEDELGLAASSIPYRQRALQVALDKGQSAWAGYAHYNLAHGYFGIGDTERAKRHADQAIEIFTQGGLDEDRRDAMQLLSKVMVAEGAAEQVASR
jgi:predicted ATPase